jgi:hypothetical protein
VRQAGGHPFLDYILPEAILSLKQGVGRLIRAETDRGVMAILDSRLLTKRYGSQVVASMPRARRTRCFEDVAAVFAKNIECDAHLKCDAGNRRQGAVVHLMSLCREKKIKERESTSKYRVRGRQAVRPLR